MRCGARTLRTPGSRLERRGLVDDGRLVVGCNVENASYGLGLCAECGMVSALHVSGGGRLVAVSCVDGAGEPLMPCGRCRQLLWEHGGPECLVDHADGPLRMAELLPFAFGPENLDQVPGPEAAAGSLEAMAGQGHGVRAPGQRRRGTGVDRVLGALDPASADETSSARGILEEGPLWPDSAEAVAWGQARTPGSSS